MQEINNVMYNKKEKIAIFIAGPPRYVTLVSKRLELVFKNYNYDCFYHIWESDKSNKKREGFESDYKEIMELTRTKLFILQKPYLENDFRNTIGLDSNGHSTINATMGMFFSMNLLCNSLKLMPDFHTYKYIFRLRTDCAIINKNLADKLIFDSKTITLSENPCLPPGYISDHLCFASVKNFFALWSFENMEEIYSFYIKGKRNPEKALQIRFDSDNHLKNRCRLNSSILRYVDFQIVYSPASEYDPKWVKKLVKRGMFKELFLSPKKFIDKNETKETINFARKRAKDAVLSWSFSARISRIKKKMLKYPSIVFLIAKKYNPLNSLFRKK